MLAIKRAISHSCIHMMLAISVVVIAGMILRILDVWRLLLLPLGHTHISTQAVTDKKIHPRTSQEERPIRTEDRNGSRKEA